MNTHTVNQYTSRRYVLYCMLYHSIVEYFSDWRKGHSRMDINKLLYRMSGMCINYITCFILFHMFHNVSHFKPTQERAGCRRNESVRRGHSFVSSVRRCVSFFFRKKSFHPSGHLCLCETPVELLFPACPSVPETLNL